MIAASAVGTFLIATVADRNHFVGKAVHLGLARVESSPNSGDDEGHCPSPNFAPATLFSSIAQSVSRRCYHLSRR